MRSFFCDKCNLEFDLEGDFDEQEDRVFCPRCTTNLARILPETPERILMRETRLRRERAQLAVRRGKLILWTVLAMVLANALILTGGHLFWLMMCAGVAGGFPAGFWMRHLTSDRTWRAGVAACVIFLLFLSLDILVLRVSGRLPVMYPALRNLTAGILPAWFAAIYEKNPA
ncbi:MAG: hypothetical protein IJS14_13935 [Lentisphaeria bacterium]|nr:hypothetical protein [Lentisphaeria bacterium]